MKVSFTLISSDGGGYLNYLVCKWGYLMIDVYLLCGSSE
jgi:hypothetical protein